MKLLFVCLCLVALVSAQQMQCSWKDPVFKGTYNLEALKITGWKYIVHDDREIEANYTYIFNVCENVASPHPSCDNLKPTEKVEAPAFQVSEIQNKCHILGSKNLTEHYFHLADSLDPVEGVSLSYVRGDGPCGTSGRSRSFTIRFLCVDKLITRPVQRVHEDDCHYSVDFESNWGCPAECPFANGRLCGAHGFCGYDQDLGRPKCFCNKGHSGKDCTEGPAEDVIEADEPRCDSVCAAVAVVVVIMGLLLLAALFMWWRLSNLAKAHVSFSVLRNDFDHMPAPETASETGHTVISMRGDIPPQPNVTTGPALGSTASL